jgi:hypothetical protein
MRLSRTDRIIVPHQRVQPGAPKLKRSTICFIEHIVLQGSRQAVISTKDMVAQTRSCLFSACRGPTPSSPQCRFDCLYQGHRQASCKITHDCAQLPVYCPWCRRVADGQAGLEQANDGSEYGSCNDAASRNADGDYSARLRGSHRSPDPRCVASPLQFGMAIRPASLICTCGRPDDEPIGVPLPHARHH